MIIPLIIMDICLFIYQHTAFRLYAIKRVKRSNYILLDRQKLKYLRLYDKVNCAYCGYANGLMAFGAEVAGKTEEYWCSIKHKKSVRKYYEPKHHKNFIDYGDKESYQKLVRLRKK